MHSGSGLHIAEFEEPSGVHAIGIVESPQLVRVLWELGLIGVASIVLQVVVQHVDGLMLEQGVDVWVLVDHVAEESLFDVGVSGAIAHSGVEDHGWDHCEEFEAPGQVPELIKEE